MLIIHTPEGAEPKTYNCDFRKISLSRATMLESRYQKLTGDTTATLEQLRMSAIQGGSAATRVSLWHVLDLEHMGKVRIEDVDPLVGEVEVKASKFEVDQLRDAVAKNSGLSDSQREMILSGLDSMATDDPADDTGKALTPISGGITG